MILIDTLHFNVLALEAEFKHELSSWRSIHYNRYS